MWVTFSKEHMRTVNNHIKRCSTSLAMRETQITMKYYFVLTGVAIIKDRNLQMLERIQRIGAYEGTRLVGTSSGTATWKKSVNPQEVKPRVAIWSGDSIHRDILSRTENTCPNKYTYANVYCSIIHNSQDGETTQQFAKWRRDKWNVAHSYNGNTVHP